MSDSKPNIKIADGAALFAAAADQFVAAAKEAVAANGRFSVALSGGSTPKGLFGLLSADPYRSQVEWDKIAIFWGDERSVPPDHSDSNYRMANESLLSKLQLPSGQVFRMEGEKPADQAAAEYEQILKQQFPVGPHEFPSLDLILLGMGPDGHTASLFPGTKALQETQRLVVSNWVGKFYTQRITMSAPLICNAKKILFLVAGADKAQPLKGVLEGPYEPDQLPSQLMRPAAAKTMWIADNAATALLSIAKEENA